MRNPFKNLSKNSKVITIVVSILAIAILIAIILNRIQFTDSTDNFNKSFENISGMMISYFNVSDAASVTWAHAVNSQDKLKDALESDIMFLEADILLNNQNVPIMAHPPATDSDITFAEWIEKSKASKKGLKLDFKVQNAVEPCLLQLEKIKTEINGPVILNADILQGMGAQKNIIDADDFLNICAKYYPESVLSIGWTTTGSSTSFYTWSDMLSVYNLLNKLNISQEITFAVRANWSIKSIYRLQWLLKVIPRSTLTIWAHKNDEYSSVESILLFRKFFPNSNVYYDLPDQLDKFLKENLNNTDADRLLMSSHDTLVRYYLKNKNFQSNLWTTHGNILKSEYGAVMLSEGSVLITTNQYKVVKNEIKFYGKINIVKNSTKENATNSDLESDKEPVIKIAIRDTLKSEVSFRHVSEKRNVSQGSINLYVSPKGNIKVTASNQPTQDGKLTDANTIEFTFTDYGLSKEVLVEVNALNSNVVTQSIKFTINSTYYQDQTFLMSQVLLKPNYAIGVDSLTIE